MSNEINGALGVNLVTDTDYYKLRNALLVRNKVMKDLRLIDEDIIEMLDLIFEKDINNSLNTYIDKHGKRCEL